MMGDLHLASIRGFTVIELLIVVTIIAVLGAAGIPMYRSSVEKSKNTAGLAELQTMAQAIDFHILTYGSPPDSLAEVGLAHMRDPWGRPYSYLRIDVQADGNGNGGGVSKARKDRNLVPINSDYDLYSMGADGQSASPLTAAISKDDLVRAQNGEFFGLGSDY